MNETLVEKYKQEIKRFLSGRIRQNLIPYEKANEITRYLASQSKNIETEHDIVATIDTALSMFEELRTLSDQEHLREDCHNKKDLEQMVSHLATELIDNNIPKAVEMMSFANNSEVTLESFYQKYPEYNT